MHKPVTIEILCILASSFTSTSPLGSVHQQTQLPAKSSENCSSAAFPPAIVQYPLVVPTCSYLLFRVEIQGEICFCSHYALLPCHRHWHHWLWACSFHISLGLFPSSRIPGPQPPLQPQQPLKTFSPPLKSFPAQKNVCYGYMLSFPVFHTILQAAIQQNSPKESKLVPAASSWLQPTFWLHVPQTFLSRKNSFSPNECESNTKRRCS